MTLVRAQIGARQESRFDVFDFGVVGDNVTDDTAAARRAYAAANLSGGIVVWPAGYTYKISDGDGLGPIVAASYVTTWSYGARFNIAGAPLNFLLFKAAGVLGAHVALTADTAAADTGVTVAAGAEAGFAVDDYVLTGSEAYYETRTGIYGAGTGQKIGEIDRVSAIAAGRLTFYNELAGGYVDFAGATQLNYKVADTAFVAKITPVEHVHFHGGTIIGTQGAGAGSTQSGVQITFGVACTIEDMRCKHVAYLGFAFLSCIESHMRNVGGADFWNNGNGYAVAFGDACQDCTAVEIAATKCRHAFTTISNGGSYGVVRRYEVNGKCWYTTNAGDAWDSHAAAEDGTYRDCCSFSSASQGINFEGSRCTITGGEHRYASSNGISLHNETRMPAMFKVTGARIMKPGIAGVGHGVVFGPGVTAGANTDLLALELDAEVYWPSGIGIYAHGTAAIQLIGARISGTVNNAQSATAAFYTQYIDKATMIGCVALNVITGSVGARQDNCAHGVITGCTTTGVAGGNHSGVYVKNADRITITGNSVAGMNKGVNLDNTSTNCVVTSNDVSGCTTPIVEGTGAGHKILLNTGDTKTIRSNIAVGGSPFTYVAGNRPENVIVQGGTVSKIEISRDGVTFDDLGVVAGFFRLDPADSLRVTYTVLPTMRKYVMLT